MADEQTQHSDQLYDAVRQAERDLEQRIEAFRRSALGEGGPASADARATHGAAAELRPTGAPTGMPETTHLPQDFHDAEPAAPAEGWRGEYAGAYLDDDDDEHVATESHDRGGDATATADPWEDAVMRPVQPGGQGQSSGSWTGGGFVPDDEQEPGTDAPTGGGHDWQTAAPAGGSWARASAAPGLDDEHHEFYSHARTALRMLQQSSDDLRHELPSEVAGRVGKQVTGQVERIMRDELAGPTTALRQLQQQLPDVAERVEQAVVDELQAPATSLRQLSEELPVHLERVERTLRSSVQHEVADVERSVAENVTRLSQEVTQRLEQVERDLHDDVDQLERGVRTQFERLEHGVRGDLEQVATSVRDEMQAPLGVLKQLHRDLPVWFERMERDLQTQGRELGSSVTEAVRDELASTRRGVRELVEMDLGGVLTDLMQASRVTLDKLGTVSDDLDRDRVQRLEDLETMLDSMTTGWQGVYGAVTRVFDRVDDFDNRIASVEEKVSAIGELEETVERALSNVRRQLDNHLGAMQEQLRELQPAPVVVTVNHPDAQVAQSTRGGFVTGQEGGGTAS